MNTDIIEGKWDQLKGTVKSQWGELTDDHITEINGDATKLSGLLQETYGRTKEQAEREIDVWQKRNAA